MPACLFLLYLLPTSYGLSNMQTALNEKTAARFYRERYGIDIQAYNPIIRQSLENLYFRGIHLSPQQLYSKFANCGIILHRISLVRIRFNALTSRVAAEPPYLTSYGARLWYLTQTHPFNEEEIDFLAANYPGQTARMYPWLWRWHLGRLSSADSHKGIFQHQRQRKES